MFGNNNYTAEQLWTYGIQGIQRLDINVFLNTLMIIFFFHPVDYVTPHKDMLFFRSSARYSGLKIKLAVEVFTLFYSSVCNIIIYTTSKRSLEQFSIFLFHRLTTTILKTQYYTYINIIYYTRHITILTTRPQSHRGTRRYSCHQMSQ